MILSIRKGSIRILSGLLFFLLLYSIFSVKASAWTPQADLPYQAASQIAYTHNGDIYMVGGSSVTSSGHTNVLKSVFSGTDLVSWQDVGNFPKPNIWMAYSASADYAFAIGGNPDGANGEYGNTNEVYSWNFIDSNWKVNTPLPMTSALAASAVSGEYLYVAGGYPIDLGNAVNNVYYSKIEANGILSDWKSTTPMPVAGAGFNLLSYRGSLYLVGLPLSPTIYRAQVNGDGSLGSWIPEANIFQSFYRSAAAIIQNKIYVLGGYTSTGTLSNILYESEFDSQGSLTTWNAIYPIFPWNNCCSPMISNHERLFVLGGHNGNSYFSAVMASDGLVFPSTSPSLSPTPTASPTPTPSAQVNKVILIPGLGASWNAEAILRCKTSGYAGGWSLSPLAQTVYQKFIESFSGTGKTLLPFYYDWRQDIRQTALKLKEFVAANTAPGEKVDIVGHSLGGLIGRAYLENGGSTKVRNFVAVGSPNRGIVRTYGAWEGGEVWNDNLIYQMAQTLALRGCTVLRTNPTAIIHKVFPSLQNILPTFDYLRDARTNMITKVDSMHEKNNYLPTGFESMFQGLFVSTVAGTNNKTAAMLEVSKPNRLESILGLWTDGKPTKQIKVHEGDDTVLVTSAQLAGANNKLIRQGHWGIIASTEGVKTIFDLLGISRTVSATLFTEPTSAVVVTSTENSISDPNGSNTTMKVYYGDTLATNFEVTPKNGKINISIGQFLRDGTVTWKDYSFARNTKLKGRLNFDAKKFKEDVLQY